MSPDASLPNDSREALAFSLATRGIELAAADRRESLEAALECFKQAIALREPLLASPDPWARYNLAGTWMNAGDAWARLGRDGDLDQAVAAFERATAVLESLPASEEPLFAVRIALAWLGRSAACLQRTGAADLESALASAREAVHASESPAVPAQIGSRIGASAWVNASDALSRTERSSEARDAALKAVALAAGWETGDTDGALIGIKARLALCRATAPLLFLAWGPSATEAIAEAVDAAEQGLALARNWPKETRLEPLLLELLRFGAQAYARRQPQFVEEFLEEHVPLARDREQARLIAADALRVAMGVVAQDAFGALGTIGGNARTTLLSELRQAAERYR